MLDSRVRLLAGQAPVGSIGETHLLVLAGLMLADELTEAKGTTPDRPDEGDQELLIAAVEHLTDRIGVIAGRLERA